MKFRKLALAATLGLWLLLAPLTNAGAPLVTVVRVDGVALALLVAGLALHLRRSH